MVIYTSAAIYIESCSTIRDKIAAINRVISALQTVALTAAETGQFSEYDLDDGQSKIKTVYRSVEDIGRSIIAFERIKQGYINDLQGSHMRLTDQGNFINRFYGRG